VLLQVSLYQVNQLLRQVARSRQVGAVLLVSSDQVMEVVDKVAARTGPSLQWKIWGWLLGNTESMLREASSIDERFWDIWEATVWFDLIRDSMGGVQCIMRRSIATEFGNHLIWAEVLNICTTEAC